MSDPRPRRVRSPRRRPEGGALEQPSWEKVLQRNYVERLKREKAPVRIVEELPDLIEAGYEAVNEDDLLRLQWHGLYHDKPKIGNFMMRIKAPGGILEARQLRCIGELSVEYGQNYSELTTRQTIQLHWLRLPVLPAVFERLQSVGLTTRGGCGDTVRNLTGCPVAGLHPGELFDPTPILREAARFFASRDEYFDLPRKHKITITACPDWCSAPEIHCQALIAAEKEGRPGFALRLGGGLASTPRLARPLGVFIEPSDAIPVLQAVLDEWRSQTLYRVSRVKARLKFMMDDYGPQAFRELIEKRLGRALEDLPAEPRPRGFTNHLGVQPQKQDGLYLVGFPVFAGTVPGEQIIAISEVLESFGGDLRLTQQQNFILTGIPEARLSEVLARMEELGWVPGVLHLRANGVACTGSPDCNFAVVNTKESLRQLVIHLERTFGQSVDDLGLRINLDGCPHACGHHWVGDIGLQGTTARGRPGQGEKIEAFDLILGGGLGRQAGIGQALLRRVPLAETPLYVERLVRAYLADRAGREPGWTFAQFCHGRDPQELVAIAQNGETSGSNGGPSGRPGP